MKIMVTIEETVSDTFEVEAETVEEALEIAKEKYHCGEFVLEPGTVTNRMIQAVAENSEDTTEWEEF